MSDLELEKAFFQAISTKTSKVEALLDDGVDVNIKESASGRNGLHLAVDLGISNVFFFLYFLKSWCEGNLKMVDLLLSKGINVNEADNRGLTPLQLAASYGNVDFVKRLLLKGAIVNVADNFGFTPLHSAIFFGRLPVIELLLSHGSDVSLKTLAGLNCLQVAEGTGNFLISEMIIKHSKSPHTEHTSLRSENSNSNTVLSNKQEGVVSLDFLNSLKLDVDTAYSATDTYGALKKKLDTANAILDKLREKKKEFEVGKDEE